MMCPVWNTRDLTGRSVCENSFYTKRAGCNSSLDRIDVENGLRPQYIEYVTLDAAGIDANMYGENIGVTENYKPQFHKSAIRENYTNMFNEDARSGCQSLEEAHKYTGQFGQNNFRADIQPTCPQYSYEQAMAEMSQDQRSAQGANLGAKYQALRREW
jgi:hypothetical protein